MQLGIFAKTFVRPSVEAVLDAVNAQGLHCVQFNMACAGLPSLPDEIPAELCERIRRALSERGLTMAAVSGTFNMIHPDLEQRRDGLRRLRVLAHACSALGTEIVTLCTGTRDPENMWRWHPDNDSPEAWDDLLQSMTAAVDIAEGAGVTLALEPETANVVRSARHARNLLNTLRASRLKVVIDPANLINARNISKMRAVIQDAFELLGPDTVLAHAKDIDGQWRHVAAGKGLIDYDCYLANLWKIGFQGPLIVHGLEDSEVGDSLVFLRGKLGETRPAHAGTDELKFRL